MARTGKRADGKGREAPLMLRAMFWLFAALWLGGDPLHRDTRLAEIAAQGPHHGPALPDQDDRRDAIAVLESRDEAAAQALIEPGGGEPAALRSCAEIEAGGPPNWKPLPVHSLAEEGADPPYSPRAPPVAV